MELERILASLCEYLSSPAAKKRDEKSLFDGLTDLTKQQLMAAAPAAYADVDDNLTTKAALSKATTQAEAKFYPQTPFAYEQFRAILVPKHIYTEIDRERRGMRSKPNSHPEEDFTPQQVLESLFTRMTDIDQLDKSGEITRFLFVQFKVLNHFMLTLDAQGKSFIERMLESKFAPKTDALNYPEQYAKDIKELRNAYFNAFAMYLISLLPNNDEVRYFYLRNLINRVRISFKRQNSRRNHPMYSDYMINKSLINSLVLALVHL